MGGHIRSESYLKFEKLPAPRADVILPQEKIPAASRPDDSPPPKFRNHGCPTNPIERSLTQGTLEKILLAVEAKK
jgi:hypothetical protein